MANILLTGGRAPVALELARVFHAAGHAVFLAESVRFPLAGPSRAVRKNYRVPPPNADPSGFVDALLGIIRRERIDLLAPTCEELFYVARGHAALSAECAVLAMPLERLRAAAPQVAVRAACKELWVARAWQHSPHQRRQLARGTGRMGKTWCSNPPTRASPPAR